jgi:hypothetical protein
VAPPGLDGADTLHYIELRISRRRMGHDPHLVVVRHHAHDVLYPETPHQHDRGLARGLQRRAAHRPRPVDHHGQVERRAPVVLRGIAFDAEQGPDEESSVGDGLVVQQHAGLHDGASLDAAWMSGGGKLGQGCDSGPV